MQICVTLSLTWLLLAQATKDCDNVISDGEPFTGICANKWSTLKPYMAPTQSGVGYAWVKYKLEQSFGSADDAQSEIDASPIPAAIGPDNKIYLVDDHHTLCALDYSGYTDTKVTVNVLCDKRGLNYTQSDFFSDLHSQGLCYLGAHPNNNPNALPEPISWNQLPKFFAFTPEKTEFTNDPWRSLAGYSRKVTSAPGFPTCDGNDDKYCERSFYRGCGNQGSHSEGQGVPYFEFQWAYFINSAAYDVSLWPSKQLHAAFMQSYVSLPITSASPHTALKEVHTDDWLDIAATLTALCRSQVVSGFRVPSSIFPGTGVLPGFVIGSEKLQSDPDCSLPRCS